MPSLLRSWCALTALTFLVGCGSSPEVPDGDVAADGASDPADLGGTPDLAEDASVVVLPPDPMGMAPPGAPGVVTDFAASVAFLWGPGGLQTGVAAGAIQAHRVAVLRGRVLDTAGAPRPGATVRVLGHPELGQTLSRADGRYDLAVNGGGRVVVRVTLGGHIEVQRTVVPPQLDWKTVEDVVLTPLDPNVATIALGAASQQIAAGSVITDADGTRQAKVIFPAGTTAMMRMPDGSMSPLSTASVRATEFTVGSRGPAAMPGTLPSTSGYTYAVELSVDEAMAAGAAEVRFSAPVVLHLENFLGFAVGGLVPSGYFDRERGSWVAGPNGRVIGVVSSTGGLASVDLDGDGQAEGDAALTAFGISVAERQELATRFSAGSTVWRVPIPHFTPWDCNWPYFLPDDARYPPSASPGDPNARPRVGIEASKHPCLDTGSVIGCETRTLGEEIPLPGLPFSLVYSSDRAPGRRTPLTIDVTGPEIPASLQRVYAEVDIAGQRFAATFTPAPNLKWVVDWDGLDIYGRPVAGHTEARGRIGYRYNVEPRNWTVQTGPPVFGQPFPEGSGAQDVREELAAILWRDFTTPASNEGMPIDARIFGLGGWSLNQHHVYDPRRAGVYGGEGLTHQPIGKDGLDAVSPGLAVAGRDGSGTDLNPNAQPGSSALR